MWTPSIRWFLFLSVKVNNLKKKKKETGGLSEDAHLISKKVISKKVQLLRALRTVCKSFKLYCRVPVYDSACNALSSGRWKIIRFFWLAHFTTYRNTNRKWEQGRKAFLTFFDFLWKARLRALFLQTGATGWRGNKPPPHCYWILGKIIIPFFGKSQVKLGKRCLKKQGSIWIRKRLLNTFDLF